MIPVLDLHTHTVASGHAFSTLQEMVAAAAEKGLQYLGITEHGPAVEESCGMILFRNYRVVPRMIDGVRLLMGVEMNILDY
ncbi:PHP domain-containing protein, partial [Muribaculum intestinale]|uniref:PHP domain-containing protein n=1 Tax=Muribaculum intestinale TaxID=1796646 RepID=UPI002630A92F